MAAKLDPKVVVGFRELLRLFNRQALVNLPDRKDIITKEVFLEEMKPAQTSYRGLNQTNLGTARLMIMLYFP